MNGGKLMKKKERSERVIREMKNRGDSGTSD